MMKLNWKQLLASSAILLGGAAQAWTVGSPFVELDNDTTLKGNAIRTGVYMNLPIAINDRYSLIPETNNVITYRDEVPTLTLRHDFIRVMVKDNALAKFDGWNLGMTYRYALPTGDTARQAGSLGTVTFRPELSKSWGDYSLMLRYSVGVHLLRSQTQLNPPASAAQPGANKLGYSVLEILSGYNITPEVSVSNSLIFTNHLTPWAKAPASKWSNTFEQYYDVVYKGAATLDTGVGLYYDHQTTYGKGQSGKLFASDATVGVRVFRNF